MSETDTEQLKSRLQTVLDAAEEHGDNLGVEYCLKCDEYAVITRGEGWEYTHIDCVDDHYDSILESGHSTAQISAWIDCINYVVDLENSQSATTRENTDDTTKNRRE